LCWVFGKSEHRCWIVRDLAWGSWGVVEYDYRPGGFRDCRIYIFMVFVL
jgi:hypothetical protein